MFDLNEARTLKRMGSNLKYWVEGLDGNPVIVFSHGATLDHDSFRDQTKAFVEKGFRVVTWDLRGHGSSKPIGNDVSIKNMANDLKAIIDNLGVDKAVLVGHSLGGYVVQMFAYNYPERLHAIALEGCTDLSMKPRFFYKLMYHIMPKMLSRMRVETFRLRTVTDLSIKESVNEYALNAMDHIPKNDFIRIIMAGVQALWTDSGIPENYIVPVPFLLVHGDSDDANGKIYQEQSPEWAKRQPKCRYEIINEAGHTAHMDNPEKFNKVLIDFLHDNIISS